MHVRHCPSCRADYRLEIARCADCGGPLEDRYEETSFDDMGFVEEEPPPPAVPPEGFEVVFTAPHILDIQPMAERLAEAGIPLHIGEKRVKDLLTGYQLYVPEAQRAAALEQIAPLIGGDSAQSLLKAVRTEFDPKEGYRNCPACSTDLPPHAAECPECGLPLRDAEPLCPECGAPVPHDAERCGNCGSEQS